MDRYSAKRLKISFVFFSVVFLLGFSVYYLTKTEETCVDAIKNQNEEDVDCGGVCAKKCDNIVIEDLMVEEKGFLENGTIGRADLYAKIYNPNSILGSGNFEYEFIAKDESGQVILTKKNSNFILPGESKYVIENNIEIAKIPSSIDIVITKTDWTEFRNQYEKPQIKVVNKQYGQISSGSGFSEAIGLLKNESPFDFGVINVIVLLRNSSNNIIALNSTEIRTVRSGENRDFRSLWTNRFSGDVVGVDVQTEVNVFDMDVYAKQYFSPEKFPSTYR